MPAWHIVGHSDYNLGFDRLTVGGGFRVDIIGGGVAGLALGIRLRRRGYSVVIYEQAGHAGGLCTGWRRGDYEFNGCLHWLLGSGTGTSFHDMWRDVVDIDGLEFRYFAERVVIYVPGTLEHGAFEFHLYNDVDRLEAYLLGLAPEDAGLIRGWMDDVRLVVRCLPELPPYVREGTAWGRMRHYMRLAHLWRLVPLMRRWSRWTNRTFAERFRSPLMRSALRRLYMDETGMTVVVFGQAYMAAGVAGYPVGGSLSLTRLLVETYEGLGGELRLSTGVRSVRVEGGRAVGLVLADGGETSADYVVSAADWRWTVGEALSGRWLTGAQRRLLSAPKESIFYSYCRVHVGYAGALEGVPHFLRLPCEMVLPDGTCFDQLEVEVCNYDLRLAPRGHAVLTLNFTTREGAWWIGLRERDMAGYREAKREVGERALGVLAGALEGFELGCVEVVDVVTPATYHRYTRNTLGSSQGWMPMRNQLRRLPVGPTLRGLEGFAMVGHWQEAGGGVPIALNSALFVEKLVERAAKRDNFTHNK